MTWFYLSVLVSPDSETACTTTRSLKLKQLNKIQPSLILLFTPMLFLPWRFKIFSIKKASSLPHSDEIPTIQLNRKINWCVQWLIAFKYTTNYLYQIKLLFAPISDATASVYWLGFRRKSKQLESFNPFRHSLADGIVLEVLFSFIYLFVQLPQKFFFFF